MRYTRGILAVMTIALFNILLVSCTSDSQQYSRNVENSNQPVEKYTLKLMTSWGGVDSKAGSLKEIVEKFETENSTIKISNQSIFGDEYLPSLKSSFASGNEPDVFGLWPGSDIKNLIKAHKVVDLTDILNQDREWKSSFKQSSFTYTTINNRIYGIPFEIVYEGLFINKDLFEKFSVKEPANYEELKTAISIFKQNDIIPIAYNSSAEGSYIYQNMIASLGGTDGVEKFVKNNKINEYYIEAMNYMKELYDLGAFPKDALTLRSSERNDLFFTKQAAMIVQGSWFIPYFDKFDDSVKMIPFPAMRGGESKVIAGLGGGTFYISNNAWNTSKGMENSVKFLKYLTSKNMAEYLYERSALISNLDIDIKADVDNAYSALANQSIGVFINTKDKNKVSVPDHVIERTIWEDIIIKQFPYFLEGTKTAEEIWNEAVEKIQIY